MKKKILYLAMGGAMVLALASCGDKNADAKVEVLDEDGNVTEVEIKETDDTEEVAVAIENVLNAKPDETELAKIAGITLEAKAAIGAKFGTDAKDELSYSVNAKAALVFSDTELQAEVSADASGTVTGDDTYVSTMKNALPSASATVFTEGTTVYAGASVALGSFSLSPKYSVDVKKFAEDLSIATGETINADGIITDATDMIDQAREYASIALNDLGYTEEDIQKFVNDGYLKITSEAHSALCDLIEEYNIKITDTTKDTITFEATEADSEDANSVTANMTVSTKTMLPVSVHADFSSMVGELISDMLTYALTGDSGITSLLPSSIDVSSIIASTLKDCTGSADATITYSAKLSKDHDKDGYTAITYADVASLFKGLLPADDPEVTE